MTLREMLETIPFSRSDIAVVSDTYDGGLTEFYAGKYFDFGSNYDIRTEQIDLDDYIEWEEFDPFFKSFLDREVIDVSYYPAPPMMVKEYIERCNYYNQIPCFGDRPEGRFVICVEKEDGDDEYWDGKDLSHRYFYDSTDWINRHYF